MVPIPSVWISRVPTYSGYSPDQLKSSHTGLLPCFAYLSRYLLLTRLSLCKSSTRTVFLPSVWASPLSLATTRGITFVFFSSGYLDVSVLRVPLSYPMCSDKDDIALLMPGSPIRISTDLRLLTTPRSVSPFAASFFSFKCLGIHRTPLLT